MANDADGDWDGSDEDGEETPEDSSAEESGRKVRPPHEDLNSRRIPVARMELTMRSRKFQSGEVWLGGGHSGEQESSACVRSEMGFVVGKVRCWHYSGEFQCNHSSSSCIQCQSQQGLRISSQPSRLNIEGTDHDSCFSR